MGEPSGAPIGVLRCADVCEYCAMFPATAAGIRAARHYATAIALPCSRICQAGLVAGELAHCAVPGHLRGRPEPAAP